MSDVNATSVRAIATKDFRDAVRSWTFWGLSLLFFLLVGLAAFAIGYFGNADTSTADFLGTVSQVTRLVVPLIALLLGWKSIAGERESGSIKVLLSLPHSRIDVVLGKYLGRATVLSLSLLIGFVIGAVVVAVMLSPPAIADYAGFIAMTILYGIAYLGIAIALSSITKSTTIAGAAMFGVFVLFYVVWNLLNFALQILMNQGYFSGVEVTQTMNGNEMQYERLPDWGLFVQTIDPGVAYANALSVIDAVEAPGFGTAFSAELFPSGVPFYLQNWFSFLILLVWIVVPTAIAIARFDRVDL
ncbi:MULTISPECIES: ABC transporter permease [Saliphagus]|uniref:ABC transporter permease n=1 Tax=Saliphagus infecundisoli TaxID=1849069 RepID=A0ABD5QIM3_9EURY|nr:MULTISPECIES: ABC transporter permease [Saliphagus]